MADYTELKAAIRAAIFDNTEQAITGESLQEILVEMVDALGVPEGGIPASELTQAVRQALEKALSAYQKPQAGIPASDIASGVIPDVSQFITKAVTDLVHYYTKEETYTQQQVNDLIGAISQFHYEIYASLGEITSPASNVLYLIGPTGSGSDQYEEYVYANGVFTKIGDTSIDLSGYLRYTPQTLTEEEKAQARQNIGAAAEGALTQNDIADNLTTDDATKVLSAKQGKVLAGQVSQLGQDVAKKSAVGVFYGNGLIAFNTTTKKASFPAGRIVLNSSTIAASAQEIDLTFDKDGASVSYGAIIVYDITASAYKVIKNNYATADPNLVVVASYYGFGTSSASGHYVQGPLAYSIDGEPYGIHLSVYGNSQMAVVLNTKSVIPLQFDSVQKKLTVKGYSRFFMNNKYLLPAANTNDSVIDLTKDKDGNTVQHGVIAYRISNRDFKIYPNNQTSEDWNLAIIATYRFDSTTSEMFINTPSYYSVDGNPYGIKVPTIEMPLYQPDYDLIELPDTVAWWSDFIKVNVNGVDELWLFCPSTGEEHASLSGYIYRVSMADWSVVGSIRHDFGHCNTCHYLPDKDILLVGNLPGNTAYPAALYIFYGVSSWAEESELRFADVDKTIVDLAALSMNNISAVFAESNGSERNIAMVFDSVTTHKVAKILLGMGSNQLAGGVFEQGVATDKFNGTYQILMQPIPYETFYTNANEVIQGIDYHNGNVYSTNGHGTIRGFIWKNTRIGNVVREQILLPCYDGAGAAAYKTSEGMIVDGDYTYQGAIPVTSEAGTTKDTTKPFAIIKYRTL